MGWYWCVGLSNGSLGIRRNLQILTWLQATAKLIAREGRYQQLAAAITLGASGSLAITNIPDWWGTDFGRPMGGFDAGRG